ncbi:GPP34 family phosphoprotein [Kineococcus gypseus]|uniref:GPP34 family phosphoprotein n=1 Tax=Kineococcus gypseus TaxID=1637102 RepID=UPI003D7E0EA2
MPAAASEPGPEPGPEIRAAPWAVPRDEAPVAGGAGGADAARPVADPGALPARVLLVALGERARYRTRGPVDLVLAGALLCEEAAQGRVPPPSTGRPGGPPAAVAHQRLLELRAATAFAEVTGPLLAAGVVEPCEHRVLRLFTRRGLRAVDGASAARERDAVLAALRPGARPAPRDAVLALLCAVSGVASSLAPPPVQRAARAELAAHLNDLHLLLAPRVAEVVRATRDAHRARRGDGPGGADLVPADGGDGYGDGGGGDAGGGGGGDGGGGGGD